jgi:peptidyl-prolyl cis-trans isomerase D
MTMLDRMRRHRGWLKWSLAIVVVTFIALYIPTFLKDSAQGASSNAVVADVDGQEITVAQFRRVYDQQMQMYRQNYGANVDERLLKQLGIDQRIVQQMIEEAVAVAEAKRLGITASDVEVRERILAMPAFQENGQFIGDERYRQILRMQRQPMRPDEFEEQVRRGIIVEKLQAAVTNWVSVPDADVEREFRKRNEKVKLALVSIGADTFREGLTATDPEIAKQFEENKESYRIGEKRKIRFIIVDQQGLRDKVHVTGQQIERQYNDNIQQYSTPEEVRASHILLKTEGKDDAAVKKQAEDLLKRAKAGEDFAALATKYSEDEGSAKKGGDLDYFGRGRMLPEFDQAAFALQPGQISDLVKTQYGYHIIKVVDKKAASQKPLAEVRQQIEEQLKWEQAQSEAQKQADKIAAALKKPSDLDPVARANGLPVHESGFFLRDEPIAGIGIAPNVSAQAFELKPDDVTEPIRTPQGFVFMTLAGKQDPYVPKLDEVKAKVREGVIKKKAVEAARQKAASLAPSLTSGDFEKTAKAAGLDPKTTELIARGSPIPDIGVSPRIDTAAFALPVGGVSDPIATDTGVIVVKVLERKDVAPAEIAAGRDQLRTELLNDRRNKFYAAYMTKARQRMNIRINRETIAQVVA